MVQTALITLGRLPKALDIARALHGAGWRVVIAEPFGAHMCKSSNAVAATFKIRSPVDDEAGYLDDLLDVVRSEGAELVAPVSEEAMYAAGIADRLPAGVRFFGSPRDELRELHNKMRFTEIARAEELAVPETCLLGTPEADALAARSDVVLKRVFSSAGIGVAFADRGAPLPPPGSAPTVVQARLNGRARNTVSLAHRGRVIGTCAYEGTIMSGTVCVGFRRIEAPDLEDWVRTFVAARGHTGFIGFDFIDDAEGRPHGIECNPRANSGVHFFDPHGLAVAIAEPERARRIGFRREILMQQFFPALTETQASLFRPKRFLENARFLARSKDVAWSGRDPWPFILMTYTSREILKRAVFRGESFGKAAVADIAWTGPA